MPDDNPHNLGLSSDRALIVSSNPNAARKLQMILMNDRWNIVEIVAQARRQIHFEVEADDHGSTPSINDAGKHSEFRETTFAAMPHYRKSASRAGRRANEAFSFEFAECDLLNDIEL